MGGGGFIRNKCKNDNVILEKEILEIFDQFGLTSASSIVNSASPMVFSAALQTWANKKNSILITFKTKVYLFMVF